MRIPERYARALPVSDQGVCALLDLVDAFRFEERNCLEELDMQSLREHERFEEAGQWSRNEEGSHFCARPKRSLGRDGVAVPKLSAVLDAVDRETRERTCDFVARRRKTEKELMGVAELVLGVASAESRVDGYPFACGAFVPLDHLDDQQAVFEARAARWLAPTSDVEILDCVKHKAANRSEPSTGRASLTPEERNGNRDSATPRPVAASDVEDRLEGLSRRQPPDRGGPTSRNAMVDVCARFNPRRRDANRDSRLRQ
jgi:hypothetical protein